MNRFDRGALAAVDLLLRANLVGEDETSIADHAETLRDVIRSEGIVVAIRRERDFEAALEWDGETVADLYGSFPTSLMELLENPEENPTDE